MDHTDDRHCYVRDSRRTGWIGLTVNLLLSALKITAGILGYSQAVLADGVHSLSDSGTDLTILFGAGYWSKPADVSHPHGHRRIETLATVGIGVVLLMASLGIAYRSLITLQAPHPSPPGWIAFGAALLSVLSKEILYRWTAMVGKRIRSSAVVANAWHHRSDALSSLPVALAVLGARLLPGWTLLDHLAGAVVSVFIFHTGWQVFWPGLKELVDVGAPRLDLERIRRIALQTSGVCRVHGVRTRYVGGSLTVDLHVLVEGSISVREGHEIAETVKERLLEQGPDVIDAVVHIEPLEGDDAPQSPSSSISLS